jgi:hypothetical protein
MMYSIQEATNKAFKLTVHGIHETAEGLIVGGRGSTFIWSLLQLFRQVQVAIYEYMYGAYRKFLLVITSYTK